MNIPWWRHQMETFSALLAICAGNSPVHGEFPTQRPVTRSFDVFFDLRLNKRLSKQSWGWWLETLLRPLWRHCNAPLITLYVLNCSKETQNYVTFLLFPDRLLRPFVIKNKDPPIIKGLRTGLEGFVVTMLEGACEQEVESRNLLAGGLDVLFVQARPTARPKMSELVLWNLETSWHLMWKRYVAAAMMAILRISLGIPIYPFTRVQFQKQFCKTAVEVRIWMSNQIT